MEEDTWTLSVHMATHQFQLITFPAGLHAPASISQCPRYLFLAPRALTRLEAACFACDAVAGWKTRSKGIGEVVFSLQFTCAWNTQTQNIDLYYILVPRLKVLLTNESVDGASGKWHQEPTSRMYTRCFWRIHDMSKIHNIVQSYNYTPKSMLNKCIWGAQEVDVNLTSLNQSGLLHLKHQVFSLGCNKTANLPYMLNGQSKRRTINEGT